MKVKKEVLMKKLNVCVASVGLVMTLHLDARRSYQVKFCSVDLHEHGCKDKEETEQAVTDDICREIDRNYTVVLSIALSILCNLMHAVPRARSECFF